MKSVITDASSAVSRQVNDVDEVLQGLSMKAKDLNREVDPFTY